VPDDGLAAARLRILELLERHVISAAEAAELIRALQGDAPAGEPRRREGARPEPPIAGPVLRVRVSDARTGRIRTNVAVPVPAFAMGLGLRLARRLRLPGPHFVDDVYEALRTGRRGAIVDVANEHGERVEVVIE
jgi:hypothetical protein